MSNIEQLRAVIDNESLPLAERKQAAQLLVSGLVDAVPEPQDDDAQVVALLTCPSADGTLGHIAPLAWQVSNECRGWARSGGTLTQARRHVHEKRRGELLKTIYQDRDRHGLEREAAAQRLLDALPPLSMERRNGITAQRLVAEAS